ncbi:hypothetical protein FOZ62_029285 [Perkinsus olseni]|uniref:Uncharacterized protein n=1 Tax=Perkinsus olseni TaxID=32597 RepID=A0A7J6RNI0_PEROL|nr:hypothetical protein FOZ62_029285 [Perkinsus olseni]
MKSLTIESLRRGQKEFQERVASLEKHRERLRQVVDHLAGQLATKDGSLRHKEVYKLTEHVEDLMASPRQQPRRDGPLVHDLGDVAAAQALVGLMPRDVAAHIRSLRNDHPRRKVKNVADLAPLLLCGVWTRPHEVSGNLQNCRWEVDLKWLPLSVEQQ